MFKPHHVFRRGVVRVLQAVPWRLVWGFLAGGLACAQPAQAQCPEALPAAGAWSDREASIRLQEQLPDACLKSLVRQCDTDAQSGFLDGGSAAACSIRYEALLRFGFSGDFQAFLRWWQSTPRVASSH